MPAPSRRQRPEHLDLAGVPIGAIYWRVLGEMAIFHQLRDHPNVTLSLPGTRTSINTMAPKAFRPLLVISLGLAILAFVTPWAVRSASTDLAIRASAVLAASWLAVVVYAFIKFGKRGLWFLLGTPLIGFWFFVLFLIAWGCAHNVRAGP